MLSRLTAAGVCAAGSRCGPQSDPREGGSEMTVVPVGPYSPGRSTPEKGSQAGSSRGATSRCRVRER